MKKAKVLMFIAMVLFMTAALAMAQGAMWGWSRLPDGSDIRKYLGGFSRILHSVYLKDSASTTLFATDKLTVPSWNTTTFTSLTETVDRDVGVRNVLLGGGVVNAR